MRTPGHWYFSLASLVVLPLFLQGPLRPEVTGTFRVVDPGPVPVAAVPDTGALASHPRVAEALRLVEVWLEAQQAYEEIPGLSAAVVHDQELVWSGAFGWADLEDRRPATPETVYSICSISKLFTALAVMQLRDRGLLELNDPVAEHLPEFTIAQTHSESAPVTVEGLLTHSAGLPRESDHPYWTGPAFDFPTREEVLERLSSQKTLYPASTYFQYSNLGLTLAGELVARRSGRPYAEYVRDEILGPLGLEDTWPEIPVELEGGRLAQGYGAITRDGVREPIDLFQARGIAPAAGYASTVEDLARFASWQFRLEPGGTEVLAGNTLREMHRVHWVDPDWDTHWGLGFSVWRDREKTYVGHGGSCPGYRTQLSLNPAEKVAVALGVNALGVSPRSFTGRIHEIVEGPIAEASEEREEGAAVATADPEERASASDTESSAPDTLDLDRFTGTYDASFGGEIAVVRWEGGLAMVGLPTDDPVDALTRLRHEEGATFRRVRDDDALGERVVFETDDSGAVTRIVRFSNHYPKVR